MPLAINYQCDWTLIEKCLWLPVYCSSRCQVKLNVRETKFGGWHGNKIVRGHRPDGNVVLICLQHSVIGWLFPQNNIQQVFQRLHALLQEEYSGEDLQIIACPSMEQVQYCRISNSPKALDIVLIIPLQHPKKCWEQLKWRNVRCQLSHGEHSSFFTALFQINLLLSVNK